MLTPYSIALFLHIVGALGMFAAIGIEWLALISLRQADNVNTFNQWSKTMQKLGRLHAPAWITILITGIYMMVTAWGRQDWIIIAFLLIVVMILLGAVLTRKKFASLAKEIIRLGKISPVIQHRLNDKVFLYSLSLRTAIALDIIYLMAVKPEFTGAVVSFVIALAAGFLTVYFKNNDAVVYNIKNAEE